MPVPIRKDSDIPLHRNVAKIAKLKEVEVAEVSKALLPGLYKNIAVVAKLKVGSKDYNLSSDRGPGAGQPKHNAFVGDVCLNAGAYVPKRMIDEIPPQCTGDWCDRGTTIPGWHVVVYPQPGDIIAYNGIPAIVVEHGTSVTVLDEVVVLTNWGFRFGHENAVVRRYMPKNLQVSVVGPKRVRFSQRDGVEAS